MTGTERIRWQDEAAHGETRGYVGSFDQPAFRIWPPDDKGDCLLFVYLVGHRGELYHGTDPDKLKAEAERILERFISSLGAAFPEEPGESAAFQLGEARAVLARWDAEQGGEVVISREKVLADQVRALLAIVDQEAAVKAGEEA